MNNAKQAPDALYAAPDVAAEVARWLGHLGAERRMSAKTLEAYERDVRQFLHFLAEHLGGAPTLAELARWRRPTCAPSWRPAVPSGAGGRSLMRGLAGARSFARFLERNGKGKVGALAAVRAPKVPKTLPKPLAVGAARARHRCRYARRRGRASHGCSPATLRF